MKSICVIGSLNIDLVMEAPKLPIIGETIMGHDFMTTQGGKGANQAVAAARLGSHVEMIGCIGDDLFGQQLLSNLIENHVDVSGIRTISGVSSGIATITIVDGNNCIIVAPGANGYVTPALIMAHENTMKNSALAILQLEIPLESIIKAIEIAKKHGVKVLLNPAPAKYLPDELLSQIDILTPNETECESLTGIKIVTIDDAKAAVGFLMKKGIPQVLITLGKHGVVYNNGEEIKHKLPPAIDVVDTTAAGDSFTAAIAVKLVAGHSIDEAVAFANVVATLTVSKKGAQKSLPTIDEVNCFVCEIDKHTLH
ncbi:MAG: ribokinase [Hyphomonadaceae bacterium]|nr:ribokinase [Clostridia bacterium]